MMKLRTAHNKDGELYGYIFFCAGCCDVHTVGTNWKFNGDMESPTFSPSVLVVGGSLGIRCHSFIEDGKIRFLKDCNHSLAGQTVELNNVEEWVKVKKDHD